MCTYYICATTLQSFYSDSAMEDMNSTCTGVCLASPVANGLSDVLTLEDPVPDLGSELHKSKTKALIRSTLSSQKSRPHVG